MRQHAPSLWSARGRTAPSVRPETASGELKRTAPWPDAGVSSRFLHRGACRSPAAADDDHTSMCYEFFSPSTDSKLTMAPARAHAAASDRLWYLLRLERPTVAIFAPHRPHRSPGRSRRPMAEDDRHIPHTATRTHATIPPYVTPERHRPCQGPPRSLHRAAAAPEPTPVLSARPCTPSSSRPRHPEARQPPPARQFERLATRRGR